MRSSHPGETTAEPVTRRLAAILAADVAGYSRLMEADEEGTLAALKSQRRELIDPQVAAHRGRIVKTTGDGALIEFASAVDAVACALAVQRGMSERKAGAARKVELRVGVNVGDAIFDEGDIYVDSVNVAARLEGLAEPGGICISGAVYDHIAGKIEARFEDIGPQRVKNISRPIQVLRVHETKQAMDTVADVSAPVQGFQGRPAIAVLPLQNMSGDPEQEYFADGIAEDILTRLAMWRWCPIIARNSSLAYKGRSVDIRQIGKELGARYVLEGGVRKGGERVRITAQLIEAETGHHVWAERYDRKLGDIFTVQDEIVEAITVALEDAVGQSEIKRAMVKAPANLEVWELHHRGMHYFYRLTPDDFSRAREAFKMRSKETRVSRSRALCPF
jgi:adenylate cyclase